MEKKKKKEAVISDGIEYHERKVEQDDGQSLGRGLRWLRPGGDIRVMTEGCGGATSVNHQGRSEWVPGQRIRKPR